MSFSSKHSFSKHLRAVTACVLCIILFLMLIIPAAREGAKLLINRVFTLSEQSNSYVYTMLPADEAANETLALILSSLCALLLCVLAPVASFVCLCAAQAYLGLCLPIWANSVICALCIFSLLRGKQGFICACAMLASILVLSVILPSYHPSIENASEKVRDWLGGVYVQSSESDNQEPHEILLTRHENLRTLDTGMEDANIADAYMLKTVEQQEVSLPRGIDYLRMILLCLLIPATMLLPFVPFAYLSTRTRKAVERRRAFEGESAARAIFGVIIGYLDMCGIGDSASLYLKRLDSCDVLPEYYIRNFRACASIWEKSVYGQAEITEDERKQLLSLLDETEKLLYDSADYRTKWRLKYVACLHI